MLQLLQKMVDEDPTRSDPWRLIGKIYQKQGRIDQAHAAYSKAIELQSDNIAAHYDLGMLLYEAGESNEAARQFDQVMRLGPETSYARQLAGLGVRLPPKTLAPDVEGHSIRQADLLRSLEAEESGLVGVGYEIQSFDGADDLDQRILELEPDLSTVPNRFRAFVELGAMYNTNVTLTPISRELVDSDSASAQAFFNPDVSWVALRGETWRAGPLGRGYFTFNEPDLDSLNLLSLQGGVFAEKDLKLGENQLIGRLDYVYGIDFLGSSEFADRHSSTISLTSILPNFDVLYGYFTTSYSDFTNDGVNPATDSLDGLTFTTGLSRFFQTGWKPVPQWSLGMDLERAQTRGDDFRYNSIALHGDSTFQVTKSISFIPSAGVGYRDYMDFTGPVNRDQFIWRVGAKLKWQFRKDWSLSGIIGHDRFSSDNEDFDSKRTQAGIVFTFTR